MASLIHLGKYGAINTANTTTMGYNVLKYASENFTLHEYITTDVQVIKADATEIQAE